LPLLPKIEIAAFDVGAGVGDGVGDGCVGGELLPPQAASPTTDARAPIRANLKRRMLTSI